MKKTLFALALAVLVAASYIPLSAGATLGSTTLAAAVTSSSGNSWRLTSTAAVSVGYGLYVDREFATVTSIPVSGTVVVQRGQRTSTSLHANASTVFLGPPAAFIDADYSGAIGLAPGGVCSRSSIQFNSYINIVNGNIWTCRTGIIGSGVSVWAGTNTQALSYGSYNLN